MPVNGTYARRVRLARIFGNDGRHLLMVPLDHSLTDGPIIRGGSLDCLLAQLAAGGADAVVLHKGAVAHLNPQRFATMSLFLHLSGGTVLAPDPDDKLLVSTVEEALRLGADGVSVHVNLGSRQEGRQLADLGRVAGDCERWSVPLLAMVYPRGPGIADPLDPRLLAHAATVAADLGADLVKTPYPGSAQAMAEVTAACPIPLLIAGGATTGLPDDLYTRVDGALRGGAAGVAVGRHVFTADDPAAVTRKLSDQIHGWRDATDPTRGDTPC